MRPVRLRLRLNIKRRGLPGSAGSAEATLARRDRARRGVARRGRERRGMICLGDAGKARAEMARLVGAVQARQGSIGLGKASAPRMIAHVSGL